MTQKMDDGIVILGMYPIGSLLYLYENETPFGGHENWELVNTLSVRKPNNFNGAHTQGVSTSNKESSLVSICVYRRTK